MAVVATVTVLALFGFEARLASPAIFQLRFNSFALLSATGVIGNLYFFWKSRRLGLQGDEARWFLLMLGAGIVFGLGEMFQRLAATPLAAVFWAQLSGAGVGLETVGLFMFALQYVNARRQHIMIGVYLIMCGMTVFFFHANSAVIFQTSLQHIHAYPWGYNNDIGPAFGVNAVWALSGTVAGAIMLARFRRRVTNPLLKQQASLFFLAFIVPVLGVVLTDILAPVIGLRVPPLHIFFGVTTVGMILFGIRRYQVFQVNPASVAQSVLDTMSESVIVVDQNLRIRLLNREAEALLGKLRTSGAPPSFLDYLSQQQADRLRNSLSELSRHQSKSVLNDVVIHGQQMTYVRLSASAIDQRQGMAGYVLALADVTELRQSYAALQHEKAGVERKVVARTQELGHAQARLLASISSLRQGFIMTDAHARILTINQAALRIFGRKESSLPLTRLDQLTMALDSKGSRLLQRVRYSLEHKVDQDFMNASYQDNIYRVYISPIVPEQSVIGAVILLDDVTEERIVQRSKDEFFSIASHELRTPLTIIRGNTNIILDYYQKLLQKQPDLQSMLHDIHDSSRTLIDIVNDFLDLSRIEQGRVVYHVKTFSLEKVIETLLYEMRSIVNQKGLYLKTNTKTLQTLPLVRADAERVKQVLYNLVGNAVKFTDKGGVTIEALNQPAGFVTVRISDTGRGIAPEAHKLLFRKFQQANQSLLTRDTTRGTGLGLYISKKLVEHMGGTIELESSVTGKGTVFSFTLPLADNPRALPATEPLVEQA